MHNSNSMIYSCHYATFGMSKIGNKFPWKNYVEVSMNELFWWSIINTVIIDRIVSQLYTHALPWRHNECDGVSNHQPHDCLFHRLYRHTKKTSNLRVIGLFEGNSPVTGAFPAQRASYAENVSIWWRHHGMNFHHGWYHTAVETDCVQHSPKKLHSLSLMFPFTLFWTTNLTQNLLSVCIDTESIKSTNGQLLIMHSSRCVCFMILWNGWLNWY